jgi:hypothetical protein
MPQVIWKYTLDPGENRIEMPGLVRPLCVRFQSSWIFLWCVVQPEENKTIHRFYVAMTGMLLPTGLGSYIGTDESVSGIVAHVFELREHE